MVIVSAVITRADGGVSLFPWESTDQAADTFERWKASARPQWLPATLETTDQPLPSLTWHGSNMADRVKATGAVIKKDGALRWDSVTNAVVVNIVDARVVVVNRVRFERDVRLRETDLKVLELDGGGVPVSLKNKRQALRDMPATVTTEISTITDPVVLEAYQPSWPA